MDCGVAGYDNTFGLPPFFPTRLRFEDYIYRLWIQQEGIAAAHVDAAQNHIKNNYMRNPPAVGGLQRRSLEPPQAEDQGLDHASRRSQHLLRLRRARSRPTTPQRSSRRSARSVRGPSEAALGSADRGARVRPARVRREPATSRSTASSPTSSSRTCCGIVDDVAHASSRARSSSGRPSSRSPSSRRPRTGCRRSASRTSAAERRHAGHATSPRSPRSYESIPPRPLRRHRARRVVPHGGARAARPRRDAVCERRFRDERAPRPRLPARPLAGSRVPRDPAAPRAAHGARVRRRHSIRRPALPHRLRPLPAAAARRRAPSVTTLHGLLNAADLAPVLRRPTPRSRSSRSPTRNAARSRARTGMATVHHGLPRDLHTFARARRTTTSHSSGGSRPRSDSTAPSRSRDARACR